MKLEWDATGGRRPPLQVLGLLDGAFGVGETAVFEGNAFGGEEAEFFGQGRARGAAGEAADGQIRCDDPMAGDFRRKRIGAQGLADGPWGAAADAARESSVSDDSARRDFAERGVNTLGEGGGRRGWIGDLKFQISDGAVLGEYKRRWACGY